ncbi:MAG: hypothetical protein ACYDAQ_15015, partial [Mycobacteriales bacterium]
LPVPGDPTGLPGPTPLGRAALAAGEAVLTAGAAEGSGVGLVPEVHEHGTPTDGVTTTVVWRAFPVAEPPECSDPVAAAEALLREAVRQAAERLARLDVARWRPELAAALDALREGARRARPLVPLPAAAGPRAQQLLDLAERLTVVVALGRQDAGGAVDSWAARDRDGELRAVAEAARRARVAAVNAPLHL